MDLTARLLSSRDKGSRSFSDRMGLRYAFEEPGPAPLRLRKAIDSDSNLNEIKCSRLQKETRVVLISWVYQCVNLTDDT